MGIAVLFLLLRLGVAAKFRDFAERATGRRWSALATAPLCDVVSGTELAKLVPALGPGKLAEAPEHSGLRMRVCSWEPTASSLAHLTLDQTVAKTRSLADTLVGYAKQPVAGETHEPAPGLGAQSGIKTKAADFFTVWWSHGTSLFHDHGQ